MVISKWVVIAIIGVLSLSIFAILILPLLSTYSTFLPALGQAQGQTNSVKTPFPLKANALELWAGTLQANYDPSLNKNKQQRLSVQDLPEGVICKVTSPVLSWLSSENRNSVLICSNDGFRASVSITINYRFVDELTSGNFWPFTLYGVGEWPEIARSSEPKTNEASNSTKPIEILQLRSNALQIWAGELQAQLNSTENIFFGTTKTISAQNIPTGVVCDVNLLNNGAWFWETKKWKLSCSYDEFRNRIDLLINGNTVRGLNDGYINIETSFTVIGVGEWPELAYERQVLQSNQSMPANDVLSLSKNDSSSKTLIEGNNELLLTAMPPLRANALQFWAADLSNQFNQTSDITSNTKMISRRDIPSGIVCNIGQVKSENSDTSSETWEINCSDEDLRNIKLRLNGNAARGLTGNNYYDTEFPFIVSGTGSWPESAYDYRESSNANDSKIQPSSESGSVNTSNIIVNPTSISSVNHTTATVSSEPIVTIARPVTNSQQPLWVDRLGAIGILAGILVVVGFIVFVIIHLFRQQAAPAVSQQDSIFKSRPRQEAEENFPLSDPQKEQLSQRANFPPLRSRENIIAESLFHFQMDKPNYSNYTEEVHLTDESNQKNSGSFSMSVSDRNKEIYPDNEYIFALEVWLVDKVDEPNLKDDKKILLSEYFDHSLKKQHESQRRFVPRRDTGFILETPNLLLDCIVTDVNYIEADLKARFHDITVNMILSWNRKNGISEEIN